MRSIPVMLSEIPELAIEVQQTAAIGAPNPGLRSDPSIRGVPGSRPPLDLDAIDILRTDAKDGLIVGQVNRDGVPIPITSHLVDRLGMCVRMVEEEREIVGLRAPSASYGSFAGCCGYLASTHGWWALERGLSDDVGNEVEQVHKALERAARVVRETTYRCDRCGHRLIPQPGGLYMQCEGCFQQVPGHKKVREKLKTTKPMTAAAMERQWGESLGIRAKTISEWKRRGSLEPVGEVAINGAPCPLYEPWQVLRVHWRHSGGVDLAESG